MSSKAKGKKSWTAEDVIQAVVIADSFNYRFLPITAEKPRALLPLANRYLIDYTVEFLVVSGVEEIFVYCCAHADQLKAHLEQSRWCKSSSPVKLRVIVSDDCPSVGDALRDIDSQSLIRSDFVLVSGDLVSNMDLQEVIKNHKKRRENDKMVAMTTVYKKAAPRHRTRSSEDDILVVTNATTNRILFCEKPHNKQRLHIPVSIFEENAEVDIHYDILDCHVSVCSPNVVELFSDNFDYQSRYHFIRGIIVNEEVLGNSIYAHFISDQYAARVSNLQTYEAISKDVIHRWVFPLVPDNSALTESYSYGRHNLYLSNDISLAFDCVLEEDVVLGSRSSVGARTRVAQSSIGRDCKIGTNVIIEGCFIWNNVVIGNDCVVKNSIIADGVELKQRVVVEKGCLLSYNVVIGEGFVVRAGSRITTCHESMKMAKNEWGEEAEGEKESTEQCTKPNCVVEDVGAGGRGFRWEPPTYSSDDESGIALETWHGSDIRTDDEESLSNLSSHSPSPLLQDNLEKMSEGMFYQEILDCIRSGIADTVDNENTKVMINGSKYAYNIPINDVPIYIIRAIFEGPPLGAGSKEELAAYVTKAIKHFRDLLMNYIKGRSLQYSILTALADLALKDKIILVIFSKTVLELYNTDIVEEESILKWHEDQSSCEEYDSVVKHLNPVVDWLKNAEEESDEESSDDG